MKWKFGLNFGADFEAKSFFLKARKSVLGQRALFGLTHYQPRLSFILRICKRLHWGIGKNFGWGESSLCSDKCLATTLSKSQVEPALRKFLFEFGFKL